MTRSLAYFKPANTRRTAPIAIDKPRCTPEWQQKADESYHRISKKYAKYSVRRDV